MFSSIAKWFAGNSKSQSAPRPKSTVNLQVENLEERLCMSWTAVPSKTSWSTSTDVGFNSNARSGTATNSKGEVDVFRFVAPRTGTYTFTAAKNGSQIDTVAGVFNWSGNRLAGNDDANSNTTDSAFTAKLTKGTKYGFAITNYSGSSTGGYKWSITGPTLSDYAYDNAGDGIETAGIATLSGNTLAVSMTGYNNSNWYYYTHRVDIYLRDANNRVIASYWMSVETGGKLDFSRDSLVNHSMNFNVSGLDLRNLASVDIVAS